MSIILGIERIEVYQGAASTETGPLELTHELPRVQTASFEKCGDRTLVETTEEHAQHDVRERDIQLLQRRRQHVERHGASGRATIRS